MTATNSSFLQQTQSRTHAFAAVLAAAASGSFLSRQWERIAQQSASSLTYPPGLGSLRPAGERSENIHCQLSARTSAGGQGTSGPAADFPASFASSETATLPEVEPQTIREVRERSRAAPFPCWPNQPRYVVFLTRDVDRFLTRLLRLNLVIWPILFLFQAQIETLWTAVFGKGFVSHFAFIRRQYEYLVASQKIEHFDPTMHPALADFHMLEIATWLAIAMCATRLITGFVFLRQFDARYLVISRHPLAKLYPLMLIICTWGLYAMTDLQRMTKISYAVPLMAHAPIAWWSVIAMVYVGGSMAIVTVLHFLTWQVFRQYWPWARLWHPNIQSNATQSREIS